VEGHQASVNAQQDRQRRKPQSQGPRPQEEKGQDPVHEQGRREEHRLRDDHTHGERSALQSEGGGRVECEYACHQEPDAPRPGLRERAPMRHV
jgi:hypothetical protein